MAAFLRRAAARASDFLGLSRTAGASSDEEDADARAGFSVRREVAVEAPRVPLITTAVSMFGGAALGAVQGLEWFAGLLRQDDDGDVADEFLQEAPPGEAGDSGVQRGARGALRTLAVTRRPRLRAWARVVGGWPLYAEPAAAA